VAGSSWHLAVAGVAGGVGTSTWSRVLTRVWPRLEVTDVGVYRGGVVDILLTSTTAAATSRLRPALAACPRPPILVVMQTVPYRMPALSRALLRQATPYVTRVIEIGHQRQWPGLEAAPGRLVPKAAIEALRDLATALSAMYSTPPQPMPTPAVSPAAIAGITAAAGALPGSSAMSSPLAAGDPAKAPLVGPPAALSRTVSAAGSTSAGVSNDHPPTPGRSGATGYPTPGRRH
jgi:hypothetical protein